MDTDEHRYEGTSVYSFVAKVQRLVSGFSIDARAFSSAFICVHLWFLSFFNRIVRIKEALWNDTHSN